MEPKNERQEKEALLEFISALNSLELVKALHVRQTPNAIRAAASRILSRLKYTTNYKAVYDIGRDKNPIKRIDYYWQPINDNGGVGVVLEYETELRLAMQ